MRTGRGLALPQCLTIIAVAWSFIDQASSFPLFAPASPFLVTARTNCGNTRLGMATETASESVTVVDRQEKILELLSACRQVGQIGSSATQEERDMLEAKSKAVASLSDPQPARVPLTGLHNLVYSAAPGGSSGKLLGPIYGKVTQEFVDNETFINAVELGPLKLSLRASRQVKSDRVIAVKFHQLSISLFGNTVTKKELSGGGAWKYLFSGEVQGPDGERKLVRIMEIPSLFVVEQPLP